MTDHALDAEQTRIKEMLRARLAAPPPPPLETTRSFLGRFCADAVSLDEVREDLTRLAAINTRRLVEALSGIEKLLDDPPPPGTLSKLVAWDGNWSLEDQSDVGAAEFLRLLADMLRNVLGDEAPPRITAQH